MLDETANEIPFRMTSDLARISYVGPQAERVLGIAQAEWTKPGFFEDRIAPEDLAAAIEQCRLVVEFGAAHEAEFRLRRDDGSLVWVRCAMRIFESPNGVTMLAGHLCDITVRRSLAADLAQSQRLEAVGRLAAGIAHEINTPVQFISDSIGFATDAIHDILEILQHYRDLTPALPAATAARLLALEQAKDLDYLTENVARALHRSSEGLERVATLVRSMKVFAHPDSQQRGLADLNDALRSTITISTNEHKYVADIRTKFGELPAVSCYIGELNQAFLNIIVNAAHAVADTMKITGDRGTITIATSVDGDVVVIAIQDSGPGIPEQIRNRIFDPFFTTKQIGKGTGQGLSIARAAVERHGGSLTFETEAGKGTTFFIRIPINSQA